MLTSPLSRAAETGAIIADETRAARAGVDPRARRAQLRRGRGAGLRRDRPPVPDRRRRCPDARPASRSSRASCPRCVALAEEHPGESLVVVSHGGAIRAMLSEVDPGRRPRDDHQRLDPQLPLRGRRAAPDGLRRPDRGGVDPPGCEDIDAQNAVEAREDAGCDAACRRAVRRARRRRRARGRGARVPTSTHTAAEAATAIGCAVAAIVKSLLFEADGAPLLVLASGPIRVDTEALGARLGGDDHQGGCGDRQAGDRLLHRRRSAARARHAAAHGARRDPARAARSCGPPPAARPPCSPSNPPRSRCSATPRSCAVS